MLKKLLCLFMVLVATIATAAEPEPVWELGVGVGSYMAPHYLGADQSATYVLPVPFLIYRGERIRADRGGLLSRLYDSEIMDIRINVSGSLPVNSEDNIAREGMPDLDLMVEAGPTLQFHLYDSEESQLRFDIPLRAAFTVGNKIDYQGLIFNPGFYYSYRINRWNLSTTLGPAYGSEAYHDYFYEVDDEYATSLRPEYDAKPGYTALRHSIGVSRQFGEVYSGLFLNFYNLNNARNEQSPLMKKDNYLSLSFALIWVFKKSDQLVSF